MSSRMIMRALATSCLCLGVVAAPSLAQRPGTLDLALLARYGLLDGELDLENSLGVGARVGLFIAPNLAIEAEHSMNYSNPRGPSDDEIRLRPHYLRLALHRPLGEQWMTIWALGWVRDRVDPPGAGIFADDGYHALLGLQRVLGPGAALRFDATLDYLPSPILEGPGVDIEMMHLGFQAGLNFRIGRERPKDSDQDGVVDDLDACAGSPLGEPVDARGCALPPGDADGDGVADPSDRCAGTPAGARVDAGGCPLPTDLDRDGVMDDVDACGETPAATRVDARGCPVDGDGDGVLNSSDACPDTPSGTDVDGRGCPLPKDSDGDGVLDPNDDCPDTAAGTRADSRGCAIIFETGETSVVLDGVTFASGRATLTPDARTILDRVAASLVNAKDVSVEVQGYTDNTGSRDTNVRLSAERADAVRAYLISKGVPAERLTARGYGPTSPIEPNTTAEGRARNRRVELKRLP